MLRSLLESVAAARMELLQSIEHARRESGDSQEELRTAVQQAVQRFAKLADQTESLLREGQQAAERLMGKGRGELETFRKTVLAAMDAFGQHAVHIDKRLTEHATAAAAASQAFVDQTRNFPRKVMIVAGGGFFLLALTLFLALTLLRPGWTLNDRQHEALRIGEEVIRRYHRSPAARQAQMRDLMEWKEPLEPGGAPTPRTQPAEVTR